MSLKTLSVVVAAVSLASGGTARAQPYSNIVVFGDSLSDNGNLFSAIGFPPPPYWEGRFSNGPVWVEQMAQPLGLDPAAIVDLAVGGSTTAFVLSEQVTPYLVLTGGSTPSDALHVVWAGANDIFDFLSTPGANPQVMIQDAMSNIADSVTLLVLAGAQDILVPNVPDISSTPRVLATGDPNVIAAVDAVTMAFNGALAFTIAQLEVGLGIDIVELDTNALGKQIAMDPLSFGLLNVTDVAIEIPGLPDPIEDLFLYWDEIHPTRVGHRIVRNAALTELDISIHGDVNGDFDVDQSDVVALTGQFGPCAAECPADLNGDGVVDRLDLIELIGLIR